MKSNIKISTENHFPYFGNGIQFREHLFGLEFDADLIQKTSELIWTPNSTLPYSTLKELPAPFNILSDICSLSFPLSVGPQRVSTEFENGAQLIKQN